MNRDIEQIVTHEVIPVLRAALKETTELRGAVQCWPTASTRSWASSPRASCWSSRGWRRAWSACSRPLTTEEGVDEPRAAGEAVRPGADLPAQGAQRPARLTLTRSMSESASLAKSRMD